jgi:sugar/nucleoside kinase (ribokinase family)
MKPSFDVLGLGSAAVDDLLYVQAYPAADGKVQIQGRERQCGGLTATALVTAARLGARCVYAGVLGKDPDSGFVLDTFRREGVNIRQTLRRPGARPIRSTIVVDQRRATRTIFFDTREVVGADPEWPSPRTIQSARVLFVDRFGLAGMIRAARLARLAGRAVVGDFEALDTAGLNGLLEWVDHLIVSEGCAARCTGVGHPGKAAAKLRARGHTVVVVTCGQNGCWHQGPGAATAKRFPAFRVRPVDTTGCGDVFHGAYAAALARGLGLEDRIRLASAAAALKATQPGGQAGIPTRAEVEEFLENHGALTPAAPSGSVADR